MNKAKNKKKAYEEEAEELGDPRPQPQVSGADFSDETPPQDPPPEKPVKKPQEDADKQGG
jgi:hypothetical protein